MSRYLKSDSGAVTVDWVVLTAALVGLGLATMAVVSMGVQDTSEDIQDQLEASDIISASFAPTSEQLLAAYTPLSWNEANWNANYAAYVNQPDGWLDARIDALVPFLEDRVTQGHGVHSGSGHTADEIMLVLQIRDERGTNHPDQEEIVTYLDSLGAFDS